MSFLALIPARFWLYAGIAAALAGLLWHDHHLAARLRTERAESASLRQDLETAAANAARLQHAIAVDQAIRVELAATIAKINTDLDDLRAHPPKQATRYVQLPSGLPGETVPAMRLDPEWLQQYAAAGLAATVPYPGGGHRPVR